MGLLLNLCTISLASHCDSRKLYPPETIDVMKHTEIIRFDLANLIAAKTYCFSWVLSKSLASWPLTLLLNKSSAIKPLAEIQRRYGLEGHRFKTWRQQGLFIAESLFKYTFPLEKCIHSINSCMRCVR